MELNSLIEHDNIETNSGPVECLGLTFENDEARRAHFTNLLAEKLKDPEFRKIEGFPIGTDEAILELSDPPYYTACPNPWLNDIIRFNYQADKEEKVVTEPAVGDIKVGKNDPAYNAHSYHTKVPHQAIIKNILHYTDPGDVVLDSFSGSGMTALAAAKCGCSETLSEMGFYISGEDIVNEQNNVIGNKGARLPIVSDLSPFATYITHNYTNAFLQEEFFVYSNKLLDFIKDEYSELYSTEVNGSPKEITFTIWSEVHICESCGEGNTYWDLMTDENNNYDNNLTCGACGAEYKSRNPNREFETYYDNVIGEPKESVKYVPVQICYNQSNKRYSKAPNALDLKKIEVGKNKKPKKWLNTELVPKGDRWKRDALGLKRIEYTHQFFTNRNFCALSDMLYLVENFECSSRVKSLLRSLVTSCISRLHKLNRYIPKHNRHVGPMSGTLYVSPLWVEISPVLFLTEKIKAHKKIDLTNCKSVVSNNSATKLMIADNSIDYIFTDPPFGENLQYSELNCIYESFLKVKTNIKSEAVVNKPQNKGLLEYRDLMSSSFGEYYRVLKPGKWITVEFSNSKNSIWIAIQEAMSKAGFVICDVSVLDKKKGTTKQLSLQNAVKQDLIIAAYKPSQELLLQVESNEDLNNCCWSFIDEHLNKLPTFNQEQGSISTNIERTKYSLFDRMVSYFVQKNLPVPLDASEFYLELNNRYIEIDGMIFTNEQSAEYRKQRHKYQYSENLDLIIRDEKSAILWLRNKLQSHPKPYSEIHPEFLQVSNWSNHEKSLELRELLELNFIMYDGADEVPSQIHTYLSTNFKDMRGLTKDNPKLMSKAKDRWFVPDPNKASDMEKVRLKALLREFEIYKAEKKKIKQPRAEALRAGFNHCWENQDLQTILDISAKIPPAVLQEDEKLLMFYDNAVTLTSNTDDDWD